MITRTTRRIARRSIDCLPFSALARLAGHDVHVLCYHMISPTTPRHVVHVTPAKTPEMFAADMSFLRDHFQVISYEELAAAREFGLPLPAGAALVTFDDGYRECLDVAAPILEDHEIPAVFFLTTSFIDNRVLFHRNLLSLCIDRLLTASPATLQRLKRESPGLDSDRTPWLQFLDSPSSRGSRPEQLEHLAGLLDIDTATVLQQHRPYLDWEQVAQLQQAGHTIGAHGVDHLRLGECSDWKQITSEIVASCVEISRRTSCPQVPFAFPFSGDDVDRNRLEHLRAENPEVGLLFDRRESRHDRWFVVHRVVADSPSRVEGPATASNLSGLLRRASRRRLKTRFRFKTQHGRSNS